MNSYRSPIAKLIPRNPATEDELESKRWELWHKQGYVILRPQDCKDEGERLFFYNKGNELYGRRK